MLKVEPLGTSRITSYFYSLNPLEMIDPAWRKYLRRSVIAALIAIPGSFLSLVGWIYWEIHATYADYDQVKACLERHHLEVIDGWQHQTLEDFGWSFRTTDGQELSLEIYDGDEARDCSHRADGIHFLSDTFGSGQYLSFDHPDLVEALDGQQLKTMDDMLKNLDHLLTWIEENPEHWVNSLDVKKPDRHLNLVHIASK